MDVDYLQTEKLTSHLKKKILVQNQGGFRFQTAGILKDVKELEFESNRSHETPARKSILDKKEQDDTITGKSLKTTIIQPSIKIRPASRNRNE